MDDRRRERWYGLEHQNLATDTGNWPLYRYDPAPDVARRTAARARFAGAGWTVTGSENLEVERVPERILSPSNF